MNWRSCPTTINVAEEKLTSNASGFWGVRTPFAPSACPFFYGWVIVFAATLGTIASIPGQTMGFTVFTDVLMEELGLSRVELSLAYCLGTVASGLTLPWLGASSIVGVNEKWLWPRWPPPARCYFTSRPARR